MTPGADHEKALALLYVKSKTDFQAYNQEKELYVNWVKAHKVWSIIIVLVILGIIGSANGSDTKKENKIPSKSSAAKSETSQQKVFDASSLVGKNIDEIRSALGPPRDGNQTEPTAIQKDAGVTQWDNSWDKDNVNLLITFNDNTRAVIDFFLAFDDHDLTVPQQKDILAAAGLNTTNLKYRTEFVKEIKDQSKFTGVKIIPL